MTGFKFPKPEGIFSVLETGLFQVLIILLPFLESETLMDGNQSGKFFGFFFGMALILVVRAARVLVKNEKVEFRSCLFDLVFTLYFVYLLVNRFLIAKNNGFSLHLFEALALAMAYLIFRTTKYDKLAVYLYAIIIAAAFQSVYGSLQLYGVFPSNHNMFNSTGGFFNPGPFAGYLAGIFPVAFTLYLFSLGNDGAKGPVIRLQHFINFLSEKFKTGFLNNKTVKPVDLVKQIALFSMLFMLVILPALRSRASWIAIIAALGYVLYKKYGVTGLLASYPRTRYKKISAGIVLTILIAGLSFGLYYFKKDSADGRVLIWKVTSQMISDNPVTGIGYEKFKAHYMDGQAAFFANNPGSGFEMVAGDNVYAFNEFLRIASETGVIGLLLVLLLIVQIFFAKTDRDSSSIPIVVAARAGILSMLVFSLFSYPAEILPIKLNFIFLLALLAGYFKQSKTVVLNRYTRFIPGLGIGILLILSVPFFLKMYQSYKDWKDASMTYQWELYDECVEEFEEVYPLQKSNGTFLISYGKALSMAGKHEKAIEVLDGAQEFLTNTILYTAMGDSYKALGEYQKAEVAYKQALNMIPNRFYPLYLLAKLYDEWGEKNKVLMVAREVLEKDVKVESTAIEEIKSEMNLLIEKWQEENN